MATSPDYANPRWRQPANLRTSHRRECGANPPIRQIVRFARTHRFRITARLSAAPKQAAQKSPPKLKTPETEASGVSILITRSTVGAASSGYPSGRPPAFAGAATSGCAGFQNSDLRRRPALQLDRWPTFRLGSVSCPSARPAANLRLASAVPLFRSSLGDPSSLRLTILVSSGLRPTILVHRACARQSWSTRLAPHRPSSG